MPNYRAYVMGPGDKIRTFKALDCPDDPTAIVAARALVDGHDIELWDGARKIARLTPGDR